jgi:4-hydroxy-2-oxoheptanedioate aldolase
LARHEFPIFPSFITMGTRLKQAMAAGTVARVFGLGQLCHPKFIEIIGLHGGYHAVWLDQEHAALSIAQIEQSALAARAVGLDSFVRLTATDYATVMRPLEAGAGGVMAAQVRSAREAADVVRWARFHPEGLRGVNGSGVDGSYGLLPMADYLKRANAEVLVAIQIEHQDAVEEVEKIAALKGVDCLFIGPADLSQSMGIPGDWENARLWQAIKRVASAAAAHGVPWAILPPNPSYAQRCLDLGCRMLSMGFDVWALHHGLRAIKQEYDAFFQQ